ncbi:hypothetical protein, partial [Halpernia frigidisoli]
KTLSATSTKLRTNKNLKRSKKSILIVFNLELNLESKKVMKRILFIVMSCICTMYFSQNNLKTFTNKNGNELLNFTYYKNPQTLENIKHGSYSYTNKSSNGNAKTIVNGKYINGFKDGVWTWDIINYTYASPISFTKYSYKVTKTFKNGLRNGQWYSKKTFEAYQGKNLISRLSWELNEQYNNNILTGKLTYKENQNLPLELNFNKNGGLIGDYLLNYAGRLRLTTNDKGVVTRYENGSETAINDETIMAGEKYLNGTLTKEQAESKNISIVKKYLSEYFYDDNVFNENGIKDPDDGEVKDGLVDGYYVLAYFNPSLIELKEVQKDNEIRMSKESFQNILETGHFLRIKEIYDKEKNTTKSFDKKKCNNISFWFLRNVLQIYKQAQERDYMNNGNKCAYQTIGKEQPVLYDFEKKQVTITTEKGQDVFKVVRNGQEITLDSPNEKITLSIPSGPNDL